MGTCCDETSLPFWVARLNVYEADSGSSVAFCVVGSKKMTYDFLDVVRLPVNVKMSLLPELLLSSSFRLYALAEDESVVWRVWDVCGGLRLSSGS